jgi:hypothetical protein
VAVGVVVSVAVSGITVSTVWMVGVGDGWTAGSALAVGCTNILNRKTNSRGMDSASNTSVLTATVARTLPGG